MTEVHNPYLAARHEWDERYGDLITRARNWRTVAVLCALTALVATAGIMWLSAHSRIVPFVVLVDSLGRPLASGIAEQATVNDDRLKRASILAWVLLPLPWMPMMMNFRTASHPPTDVVAAPAARGDGTGRRADPGRRGPPAPSVVETRP